MNQYTWATRQLAELSRVPDDARDLLAVLIPELVAVLRSGAPTHAGKWLLQSKREHITHASGHMWQHRNGELFDSQDDGHPNLVKVAIRCLMARYQEILELEEPTKPYPVEVPERLDKRSNEEG